MSKTIRRKHEQIPKWARVDGHWEGRLYIETELQGKELAKAAAIYHSDMGCGYSWSGNAPKDFRKSIDRIKRAKEKAETRRILKERDFENYNFNPRKRDAGWLYW